MRRFARAQVVVGVAFVALAGDAIGAQTITVNMNNIAFEPQLISAHVGDTIEWVNGDIVAHTATARNRAWDVLIAPHAKKMIVLKSVGSIQYFCKFHPNMTGQIDVVD